MFDRENNKHDDSKSYDAENSKRVLVKDGYELAVNMLPKHIAIIPDGNGRWSSNRYLARTLGHASGMRRVREIIRATDQLHIPVLTFFAFSTENWQRPSDEVSFLLDLPINFLKTDLKELVQRNVQVRMLGDRALLPQRTLDAMDRFEAETNDNTGLIINFAVNYGSRAEIIHAVRNIAGKVSDGELQPHEIDDRLFAQHLLTKELPDPDLVIRTSGEMRISNFFLWQIAYSELIFVNTLWPDFTVPEFHRALHHFQLRSRRYGSIG